MSENPFLRVPKADQKSDRRRQRRALTETELLQLLDIARRRPLIDAMTVRRGKRKGDKYADLRPETVARLELLGKERALIYKTLVLTGLRVNELRTLTIGQLDLEGSFPHLVLKAANEKNRQGNTLPIREDLAKDLRNWIAERMEAVNGRSSASQGLVCLPMTGARHRPSSETPVFTVPKGLIRILDRDLRMAGIPKTDERGRTVDLHAMRHTLGTLLSKGGVSPRTAQAVMRHSTINLTMNTYTDPKLLDVAGALDCLPDLSLDGERASSSETTNATGTYDLRQNPFAPLLAPTSDKTRKSGSLPDKKALKKKSSMSGQTTDASTSAVKRKDSLTSADNESEEWAMRDSNPRHPRCKQDDTSTEREHRPEVMESTSIACTNACTSTGEIAKGDVTGPDLNLMAALLLSLSPADRVKLAGLLIERSEG